MKHILLVGGHDEAFSYIKNMDYRFSVIQIEEMLGDIQHSIAQRIKIVKQLDSKTVFTTAEEIHLEDPIDFIFSFTEDGLLPASYSAKNLGIPGIDHTACQLCIDKVAMREKLERTEFAIPARLCSSIHSLIDLLHTIPTPIVLKDATGSGSKYVGVANTHKEAIDYWNFLKARGCASIIAEQYLPGTEYSLETLSIRGQHEFLGITQKKLFAGTVIEQQHVFPAPDLSDETEQSLKHFALTLLKTIQYVHGPCHIEVKIDDGGAIRLIEINNRAGGDFIWQMLLLVKGVDCIRETLEFAFNGSPDSVKRSAIKQYEMMSSIALFHPVNQKELPSAIPKEVEIVRLHCDSSKHGTQITSSDDRFGFLVIGSNSSSFLLENLPKVVTAVNSYSEGN